MTDPVEDGIRLLRSTYEPYLGTRLTTDEARVVVQRIIAPAVQAERVSLLGEGVSPEEHTRRIAQRNFDVGKQAERERIMLAVNLLVRFDSSWAGKPEQFVSLPEVRAAVAGKGNDDA